MGGPYRTDRTIPGAGVMTMLILLIDGISYVAGSITFCVILVNVSQSVIEHNLLFAYCYNLYGGVLWDLNNCHVESVCVTWRKGQRRAWSLPSDTHCALLPVLSNALPVIDELAKRFVRFLQKCLSSDSYAIRFIANYGMSDVCFHLLGVMHFSVVLIIGFQQITYSS